MALSKEQYESIQQYLDDTMTPEQEENFMQEVKSNSALQEYIQFELVLRQTLQMNGDDQKQPGDTTKQKDELIHVLSLVQKAGKEWREENKKKLSLATVTAVDSRKKNTIKQQAKFISFPFGVAVAAAACLIFVMTGIVWYVSDTSSPQFAGKNDNDSLGTRHEAKTEILVVKPKDSLTNTPSSQTTINVAGLYKQFYKKDNAPMESRTPELLAEALNNYEHAEYKTLQNFNLNDISLRGESDDINSEQNIKEIGHYYKGLAFLQSNNLKQAADNLQWVIDRAKNKQLVVKAQWYQALCYLQQRNIKNAIDLLTLVSNKTVNPYNKQAAELLPLLNQ